jgi:hypothetical protein
LPFLFGTYIVNSISKYKKMSIRTLAIVTMGLFSFHLSQAQWGLEDLSKATGIKLPTPATTTKTDTTKKTTTTTTTTTTTKTSTTGGGSIFDTPASGAGTTTTGTTTTGAGGSALGNFTQTEAANAIKDALLKGITKGVDVVSLTDGYFKNAMIKILLPPQVKSYEATLRKFGAGTVLDNMVKSMNRAAEQAAPKAKTIFVNSITQMTVTDAVAIVSNQQPDAATQFLKRTTTENLVVAFKPSIKTALDKTLATKYWGQLMTYYNKIPFVTKINTDLPDYVTRKGIDGLFYMVAQEEAKIRKDPAARTTDILKKVFGGLGL